MNDMFAFLRESGEKPEPNVGMKIMAGVDEPEARCRIPRVPAPKKFPPGRKYHELPKWSGEAAIATPWVREFLKSEVYNTAKDKYKSLKSNIRYMLPNPLEKMAEDAANWHLTKNKRK
ncbi:MAG: hypothetical protein LBU89_03290 [Fibromonadaceae bacterium]|nr:hypothetical protein [Fibromonadaceae bacterium]